MSQTTITDAELDARFAPVYARIAEGAVAREQQRTLAHEPVAWLREARFGALRVPRSHGGSGATLPQLLRQLVRLGKPTPTCRRSSVLTSASSRGGCRPVTPPLRTTGSLAWSPVSCGARPWPSAPTVPAIPCS